MSSKKMKMLKKAWGELKREVQNFSKDEKLGQVQTSIKNLVQDAQEDLGQLVKKDFNYIIEKFEKEKDQVGELVEKVLSKEIQKARGLVDDQLKNIDKIQKNLDIVQDVFRNLTDSAKVFKKSAKKKTPKKEVEKVSVSKPEPKVKKEAVEKEEAPKKEKKVAKKKKVEAKKKAKKKAAKKKKETKKKTAKKATKKTAKKAQTTTKKNTSKKVKSAKKKK